MQNESVAFERRAVVFGAALFAGLAGAQAVAKDACAGERFQIYEDARGQWRWTLYAKNGEPIAQHEGYTSRAACEDAVDRVRSASGRAKIVFERDCKD